MKMKIKILILFVFIILTLSSCDNSLKFKNDGTTGNLIDETNGRYYIYCGSYLKAAEIDSKVYATGDGTPQEKLHEITGIDPAEWLSEDISQGIALLFREKSVEEPKLESFETKVIHITMAEEVTLSIGAITDKTDIAAIVNDYLNNPGVQVPEYTNNGVTLYFESESDKYKNIYYVLQYFVDDKNVSYLYDRWTRRCVVCSVNIFAPK